MDWLKLLAEHPELFAILKQVLALLEQDPELRAVVVALLKKQLG